MGDPVLVQRVTRADGATVINVFNTGAEPAERLVAGHRVTLAPFQSQLITP